MPNFTISRNLASGLLRRQSGQFVRALANEPLSSVGDGMRFPLLVQNLAERNESIDNAYWSKSGTTVSANTTESPAGDLTADSLVCSAGDTNKTFFRGSVLPASGNATIIVFAKKKDLDFIYLRQTGGNQNAFFNIANGTLGTVNVNMNANIKPIIDGWYMCTVSFVATGGNLVVGIRDVDGSSTGSGQTYNAVGGEETYFWGVQLYASDVADTITPADIITTPTDSAVTGVFPDVSQNIGAWGDITFLMDINIPPSISSNRRLMSYGVDNSNQIELFYTTSGLLGLHFLSSSSGTWAINGSLTIGNHKIAVKLSNGNNRIYVNGVLFASNTNVYIPTNYDLVRLGQRRTGTSNRLEGAWLREFNPVPFMSDADAQAWTQP
jgi:hypothetical protein